MPRHKAGRSAYIVQNKPVVTVRDVPSLCDFASPRGSCVRLPRATSSAAMWWLEPTLLQRRYIVRVLVLRALITCLWAVSLDDTITLLAHGSWEGRTWGLAERIGMMGLTLPLIINAWGLAWPLLQLRSFEKHHLWFHRGVQCISVAASVAAQLTGLVSNPPSTALLQSLLYCIHQDPQYMAVLAATMGLHTLAHFAMHGSQAYPLWEAAEGGWQTTVNSLLLCVLVQQVYNQAVSSRHKGPPASRAGAAPPDSKAQQQGGMHKADAVSNGSCSGVQLSQSYCLKLAAVKGFSALFLGLSAMQCYRNVSVAAATIGALPEPLATAVTTPVLLAVPAAAAQLLPVCLCLWWRTQSKRWHTAANLLSLYSSAAVLVYRMTQGAPDTTSSWGAPALSAQHSHAFPSFLLLAGSLAAHEDAGRWFTLQLTALGALMRHLHLAALPDAAQGVMELPEYWLVVAAMSCVYNWLCVGKWEAARAQADDEPCLSQPASRLVSQRDLQQVQQALCSAGAAAGSQQVCPICSLHISLQDIDGLKSQRNSFDGRAAVPSGRASSIDLRGSPATSSRGSADNSDGGSPASRPRGVKSSRTRSILWADSSFPAEELAKMAAQERQHSARQSLEAERPKSTDAGGAWRIPTSVAGVPSSSSSSSSTWAQKEEEAAPDGVKPQHTSGTGLRLQLPSSPRLASGALSIFSKGVGTQGCGSPKSPASIKSRAPTASEAGTAQPEQQETGTPHLVAVQRTACDVLMALLAVPPTLVEGPVLLRAAVDPTIELSLLGRLVAVFLVLIWAAWPLCQACHLVVYSEAAMAHRQLLWSLTFAVPPLGVALARTLLQIEGLWSARISLMVTAGGMGLLDTSVPTFIKWLPPVVSCFYGMNTVRIWSLHSWGVLLLEMLEFNLFPVATYALIRFTNSTLQCVGVQAVYSLFHRLGGRRVLDRQRLWAGAAAVLSQMLVGGLLCWVLAVGPVQLPKLLDPLALLDERKEQLSYWLDRMSQPGALQLCVSVLGVAVCALVLPLLQALAVLAPGWLTKNRGPAQRAAGKRHDWANKPERLKQQRMAVDAFSCITAAPVLVLLYPRLVSAVLWPLPGVGAFRRLLGLSIIAATLTPHLAQLWLTLRRPRKALQLRNILWPLNYAAAGATITLANAILGIPSYWPSVLTLMIHCAALGLMDVPHLFFATWYPLLSCSIFGIYTWEHWSTTSWSLVLYEAVEFNVYAMFTYGATRLFWRVFHKAGVDMVYSLVNWWYADQVPPSQQQYLPGVASVTSHVFVTTLPMWAATFGPSKLPPRLDPFAALAALKGATLAMLQRLDLSPAPHMASLQTSLAVLGLGAFFLAVSSVQALVLNNPAFRNPRQRRYEACKARLMALGEKTMSTLARLEEKAGPRELRAALLHSLNHVVEGCFPGCSLLLVLLEEGSLESEAAMRYVVAPTPGTSHLAQAEEFGLEQLPSVEAALRSKRVLAGHNVAPGATGWLDWDALAEGCGLDSFLVVPLHCANQDMGALMVTSASPVSLDKYTRKLAMDLGHALSQAVYTLDCIGQMKASDKLIHDILPEKVAEQLRRRMVSIPSSPGSLHDSAVTVEAPWKQLQQSQHLQLPPLKQNSSGNGRTFQRKERRKSALGCGDVPVVYKSWHPAVSVLFADISGYTAMSTSVEPEQVMLLLHELFSRYDNLCSHYNVYKVETIGDCYMACCALLTEDPDHAAHLVQFGQAMLGVAAGVAHPTGGNVRSRVGIHSGRVMSGVVGSIRARYCLFGDTVNTASRMESTGVVDHIQVTEDTYQLLGPLQGDFQPREAVEVKGKGVMQTYLLRSQVAEQLRVGAV